MKHNNNNNNNNDNDNDNDNNNYNNNNNNNDNDNNNNNNNNVFIQLVYKFAFYFEFLDFSSIFSIFSFSYLVAGGLSEPIGFLVSSPYNLSYGEKAGIDKVRITTIIKGLKTYSNNYSNN